MTSRDLEYWPKGEAYQTPRPVPELIPVCECGLRHLEPAPSCGSDNSKRKIENGRWA